MLKEVGLIYFQSCYVCYHQRAMCKCTGTSWGQLLQHIITRPYALIYSISPRCSLPFCPAVAFQPHTGWELYMNGASGQRLSMCFLLAHLEAPLWWAAVRNSFRTAGLTNDVFRESGSSHRREPHVEPRRADWQIEIMEITDKRSLWKCMQN